MGEFVGHDAEAFADDFLGLGEGDADALLAMGPAVVGRQTEEEVFAGDDQHAEFFESLVEFARGDRQLGKPQPEEERAFVGVHLVREAVGELGLNDFLGELRTPRVEGADRFLAESQEFAAGEQRAGDRLADVVVGEADDGRHAGEPIDDLRVSDDDGGAAAGQADF